MAAWTRPLVAGAATAGVFVATEIARAAAQGDVKRLAAKYPNLAVAETTKATINSIPIIGGIVNFFAAPAIDKAAESGMSDEDTAALERDHLIVTWAPVVGAAALILGIPVTLYFVWTDLIRGPTISDVGRGAEQAGRGAALAAAVPLSVAPTPAAQEVAPVLARASEIPVVAPPVVEEVHA